MGIFYDLYVEADGDARLLADHIMQGLPGDFELDRADVLSVPECPLRIRVYSPEGRGKSIKENLLAHPVRYCFSGYVRDSRHSEAADFLVGLLVECGSSLVGPASLVCYGERLLFMRVGESVAAYGAHFWTDRRRQAILAAFAGDVDYHDEARFL